MATDALTISRPYGPSWFDRLKGALERSRLPWWTLYAVLTLLPVPLVLAADVAFGMGSQAAFHVYLAMVPGATLWLIHLLDRVCGRAFDQAAPKLRADAARKAALRYELTNMPAGPALLAALAGVVAMAIVTPVFLTLDTDGQLLRVFGFRREPGPLAMFVLLVGTGWVVGFVFLYHTFRQLRIIGRTYTNDVVVDTADLRPVYAFSRVTALSAIGLQVQADLWIVTNPQAAGQLVPVATSVLLTAVAAVIFVVPLVGAHLRIADELSRRLAANARSRDELIDRLRPALDADDRTAVTALKDGVLALEVEARALAAVRTWPWEPETLRLLLTAVLLPTAVFVIQYAVREILGP